MATHRASRFWRSPLALAVVGLLLSWWTLRLLVDAEHRAADMPIYRRYGELIVRGLVPYRDFDLEYPPGAAAVFAAPAFVTSGLSGYMLVFEALMILCAALALAATDASLRALHATRTASIVALLTVALAPLALATVAVDRFDFLPAALVALWLALELHGRHRWAAAVLGLAVAVKVYPVALLPIAVVWWDAGAVGRSGRRHRRHGSRMRSVLSTVHRARAGRAWPTACSDSSSGHFSSRASGRRCCSPRIESSTSTSRSRPPVAP